MNKQCICPECGAIAEVRRVSNGRKLRYLHCKHGHGGLNTRKEADKWEALEQDYIGEFGSMPESAEITDNVDIEVKKEPEEIDQHGDGKGVCAKSEVIEQVEVQEKAREANVEAEAQGLPMFAKVGLIALSLLGVGGALYTVKKKGGEL